jgi:hypothetical protein
MHFFAECKEGVDVCVRGDLCDAMIRPRLEEGEVDVEVAARVRAMQRCTGVQCRRPLLPTSDPSGWDTSALVGPVRVVARVCRRLNRSTSARGLPQYLSASDVGVGGWIDLIDRACGFCADVAWMCGCVDTHGSQCRR